MELLFLLTSRVILKKLNDESYVVWRESECWKRRNWNGKKMGCFELLWFWLWLKRVLKVRIESF